MSSNSFQLIGTAGGAANGYWTTAGINTTTLASGINFTFESFPNFPKLCRLTMKGTATIAASAAGDFRMTAIIPQATLPKWCRPTPGSDTSGSIGMGNLWLGPVAISANTIISTSGGNLYITIRGTASALVAGASTPVNTVMTYFTL